MAEIDHPLRIDPCSGTCCSPPLARANHDERNPGPADLPFLASEAASFRSGFFAGQGVQRWACYAHLLVLLSENDCAHTCPSWRGRPLCAGGEVSRPGSDPTQPPPPEDAPKKARPAVPIAGRRRGEWPLLKKPTRPCTPGTRPHGELRVGPPGKRNKAVDGRNRAQGYYSRGPYRAFARVNRSIFDVWPTYRWP